LVSVQGGNLQNLTKIPSSFSTLGRWKLLRLVKIKDVKNGQKHRTENPNVLFSLSGFLILLSS